MIRWFWIAVNVIRQGAVNVALRVRERWIRGCSVDGDHKQQMERFKNAEVIARMERGR